MRIGFMSSLISLIVLSVGLIVYIEAGSPEAEEEFEPSGPSIVSQLLAPIDRLLSRRSVEKAKEKLEETRAAIAKPTRPAAVSTPIVLCRVRGGEELYLSETECAQRGSVVRD